MPVRGYNLKFRLNVARNSKYTTNAEAYFHAIEITLVMEDMTQGLVRYEEIEAKVNEYFSNFSDKLLNNVPPFVYLDPTLENIAIFFYDQLKIILLSMNLILYRLDIQDKSTRVFTVSEEELISQKARKLNMLIAENKNLRKDAQITKGGK